MTREHGELFARYIGGTLVLCLGLAGALACGNGDAAPEPATAPPAATPPPAPPEPRRETPRWRDVKVEKAPYAPPRAPTRPPPPDGDTSEAVSRPRETPFDRAMRPYARNDFAGAAAALAPLARGGDVRASFYLGVSLLLLDRNDDAVSALERAAASSRGQLGAQVHYYLGVAYLRTYRFEEALHELKAAQEGRGPFASRAAELEEEVRTSAL
jgi:hypothetical protein